MIYLFIYLFRLTLTLDKDFNLYYHRSTMYIALGHFDQVMEDDDECEWQMSEH